MPFIYVIKNDINEHKYIGKTSEAIERRFQQHLEES
jgi:predicted GIY-YIG superfamily endonuclease